MPHSSNNCAAAKVMCLLLLRYYRDELQSLEPEEAAAVRPRQDAAELLRQAEEQAEAAEVWTLSQRVPALCFQSRCWHTAQLKKLKSSRRSGFCASSLQHACPWSRSWSAGIIRLVHTIQQSCCCLVLLLFASMQVQLLDEKSLRKMLNAFEKKVCSTQLWQWLHKCSHRRAAV